MAGVQDGGDYQWLGRVLTGLGWAVIFLLVLLLFIMVG